jgi:glycosyltransferase involved in cell wall biosynthesis
LAPPLATVVTPVYNGAETLAQCIESVLAQTYRNWEYIVVDNCSTDETPRIIEQYVQREPRIRVFRNERTVSAMQNHQIAFGHIAADSRYCKIVQADDWIFPECLERMVALAEAHPSVAMVSAYRLEEQYVTLDGLPYPSTIVSGRDICRLALLGEVYVFGTPTSLLLRTDVVRSRTPFYDETTFPRHYDTAVCYEVLREGDLGFVHQVLTFTRRQNAVRTAESLRMGSSRPEHIAILKRYGPVYLAAEEYDRRLHQMTRSYYRFLGGSALQRRDRAFWNYHRRALEALGLSSSRMRIWSATAAAAAESILRPFRFLTRDGRAESGAAN